jgi:uncharacterized protein YutE (UPF0331/DUF86 family)
VNIHPLEDIVVERLIPELQADGYDVIRQPVRRMLPAFLGDYTPDLIALKTGSKLAIEVSSGQKNDSPSLESISKLFKGHEDWEFRVIWLSTSEKSPSPRIQGRQTILASFEQCKELARQGHHSAAMLLSWATLEAIGRNLMASELARPQTPGRVIEYMAQNGVATPKEADRLRALVKLRNSLVHGELDAQVNAEQTTEMLDILRAIISFAELDGEPASNDVRAAG